MRVKNFSRKKQKVGKQNQRKQRTVTVNAIVCANCRDILVSWFRHDLKTCSCESEIFVDGGQEDYTRIGALDPTAIIHAKLVMEVPHDEEQTIS